MGITLLVRDGVAIVVQRLIILGPTLSMPMALLTPRQIRAA